MGLGMHPQVLSTNHHLHLHLLQPAGAAPPNTDAAYLPCTPSHRMRHLTLCNAPNSTPTWPAGGT